METKFNHKPISTGNSYRITVPKYLIRAGLVDPTKEYEVVMREVEECQK